MKAYESLEGIAGTLANPAKHKAMRLPDFPQLEKTAVLHLTRVKPYSVPLQPGYPPARLALCKCPAAPLWADTVITGGQVRTVWNVQSSGEGWSATIGENTVTATIENVITSWPEPHRYVIGTDGQFNYHFHPAGRGGATLQVGVTVPTFAGFVSTTCYVTIRQWKGPGQYADFVRLVDTPAEGRFFCSFLSMPPGFYRPVNIIYGANSPPFGTPGPELQTWKGIGEVGGFADLLMISTPTAEATLLPMGEPPEFATSAIYHNTRVTAVSLLATNTTKLLNKEGTVSGARLNINTERVYPWSFDTPDVTSVHPSEFYSGKLEDGAYTFCGVTQESLKFRDCVMEVASGVFPVVHLDGFSIFNALVLTDPDIDSVTSMLLRLDLHLEFRTSSAIFSLGYSQLPLEAMHAAMIALTNAGFFYTNSWHEKMLTAAIAAGRGMLGSAASTALPLLLPVVEKLVGDALSKIQSYAKRAEQKSATSVVPKPPQAPRPKPKASKKVSVARMK